MKENNRFPMKVSPEWYEFLENFSANRVKVGMEKRTLPFSRLPDIIIKYFKLNNDRYLDLVKMEYKNGNK